MTTRKAERRPSRSGVQPEPVRRAGEYATGSDSPRVVIESMTLEEAVKWVLAKGEDPNVYSDYLWAALLDDETLERAMATYQDLKKRGYFKSNPDGWVTFDALVSESMNRRWGITTTFRRVVP